MRPPALSLAAAGLLLAAAAGPAADPPAAGLRRWAVLAESGLKDGGLADLLAAELSKAGGVEMVERDRLREVTKELALGQTLGAAAVDGRLKLGQLLRADALVCLGAADADEPGRVRVVVSECRHGARLSVLTLPARDAGKTAAALAAHVGEVRGRFQTGVGFVVGLAPFACGNVSHEFDRLGAGYTALVEAAFLARPGVAVLEVEEARAVAAERVVGGPAPLPVPLFVEGEYRVDRRPGKGAEVAFKVKLATGRDTLPAVERAVPLGDAGRFLGTDLPAEVLKAAPAAARQPLPPDQQFARLVAAADRFTRIGVWDRAAALRDAALAIDPTAHAQRRRYLDDYLAMWGENAGPVAAWWGQLPFATGAAPVLLTGPDADGRAERWVAGRLDDWRHALGHLDLLVRAGGVDLVAAGDLYDRLCEVPARLAPFVPEGGRKHLAAAEEARRTFLRETFPQVLRLKLGPPPRDVVFLPYSAWERRAVGSHLTRFERRTEYPKGASPRLADTALTKADLDLALELAATVVPAADRYPDGMPVGGALLPFVAARAVARPEDRKDRFSAAEFAAFLDALAASPRKRDSLVGRAGKVWVRWAAGGRGPLADADRAEIEAVDREWEAGYAAPIVQMTPRGKREDLAPFYRNGSEGRAIRLANARMGLPAANGQGDVGGARAALPGTYLTGPGASAPLPPAVAPVRPPAPPPRPGFAAGARVKTLAGEVRAWPRDGWKSDAMAALPRSTRLVRCGDKLDVLVVPGAVLVQREKGLFEERVVDPGVDFRAAAWDGAFAWVGSGTKGLWAFDGNGALAARVEPDALPPADRGLVLHPVGPGKVLAVGSLGEYHRGWCAWVERTAGGAAVKVFHEARRVWSEKDGKASADDPAWSFAPAAVLPFPGRPGTVLVWRQGPGFAPGLGSDVKDRMAEGVRSRPLTIDLATGAVGTHGFPRELSAELVRLPENPPQAWDDRGLYLFGAVYAVDGRPLPNGKAVLPLFALEDEVELVRDGGVVYAVGAEWFLIDPKTLKVDWLGAASRRGAVGYGVSAHLGLVGFAPEPETADPGKLDRSLLPVFDRHIPPHPGPAKPVRTPGSGGGPVYFRTAWGMVVGGATVGKPTFEFVWKLHHAAAPGVVPLESGATQVLRSPDLQRGLGLTAAQVTGLRDAVGGAKEQAAAAGLKERFLAYEAAAAADKPAAEGRLVDAIREAAVALRAHRDGLPARVRAALRPEQVEGLLGVAHGVRYIPPK